MKNEDQKLNENEQSLLSTNSVDNNDSNSNWIDADTYSSLQTTKADEELVGAFEELLESSNSCDNNETNSNWVDADIYTSSETAELGQGLDEESKKSENENITKTTFFNQIKHSSTTILNKCRKDNRSLITGFLIVAALSCCITISVINLFYKDLQTSSQRFEIHGETRPSKNFNHNQIPNQNNNQFELYSNAESVNELTDEQTEAIIKYYFQYQQGSSNQKQPF